jgi:hypothetical protein
MKDKEVGELWRHIRCFPSAQREVEVVPLIRKLVEERAMRMVLSDALRDFGIKPKDWPFALIDAKKGQP